MHASSMHDAMSTLIVKMPKRRVLKGQRRQLVLQLYDYFKKENQNGGPLIPISQVQNRVSATLGISLICD